MPGYAHTVGAVTYRFPDLRTLLAKATPARAGDSLAGLAAPTAEERVAAQMTLAEVPLAAFLSEPVVPYEADEVTRLILDRHDAAAFAPVAHLTVGDFRDWLLAYETDAAALARARARPHARDGGGGLEAHAQPGPGDRGAEVPGRHALPQHARPRRAAVDPPPAQPPDRRPEGHRRQHPRRPALRLRRRGDRHQPGDRQPRAGDRPPRDAGRHHRRASRSRRSPAC